MKSYIKRLLDDMRNRPVVYFGCKSLDSLATFLSGYMCRVHETTSDSGEALPGFQEFVQEKYGIQSSQHWSQIIRFFSATEESAFDEFFKLLDEYYTDNT
ncbi:MAG: hypothetical protein IJF54_01040 [Clostridia bacterium]|nr:hypothetical protein [Clostridia bacterium]